MLSSNGASTGGRGAGWCGGGGGVFTATQWQELEHQALIYKYMATGVPVPADLLLPLRRSSFVVDTSPSLSFPPSSLGWPGGGVYHHQMGLGLGFGRKPEDLEPWRCRRTDGKKWRCSKEAFPDSKYCEKHMHRGKNRSRKPVEHLLSSFNTPSSSSSAAAAINTASSSAITSMTTLGVSGGSGIYPFASSAACGGLTGVVPLLPPYYYYYGAASDHHHRLHSGERAVFMADVVERDSEAWPVKPMGVSKDVEEKSQGDDGAGKHCFLLGTELRLEKFGGSGRAGGDTAQQPLHHFFDELPHEKSNGEITQLSMSIPMSSVDRGAALTGVHYRS